VKPIDVRGNGDAVRFTVRVQPRASANEFAGAHGTALKVRLAAPPVDGMANDALIDLLAKTLDIPRRNVSIVSGHSSRTKNVEIRGVGIQRVRELAG
jgi:uncharacterized protein (TIGR00251 family)